MFITLKKKYSDKSTTVFTPFGCLSEIIGFVYGVDEYVFLADPTKNAQPESHP